VHASLFSVSFHEVIPGFDDHLFQVANMLAIPADHFCAFLERYRSFRKHIFGFDKPWYGIPHGAAWRRPPRKVTGGYQ